MEVVEWSRAFAQIVACPDASIYVSTGIAYCSGNGVAFSKIAGDSSFSLSVHSVHKKVK